MKESVSQTFHLKLFHAKHEKKAFIRIRTNKDTGIVIRKFEYVTHCNVLLQDVFSAVILLELHVEVKS
jgi:hypothetical protein